MVNKVVPLQTNVKPQISFKDFLLQVKDTTIGAYSHQSYPFNELVRLLKLPEPESLFNFWHSILLENIHSQDNLVGLNNDITVSFLVKENTIGAK